MPLRKTAIAVSEDLLQALDQAARERGESRNAFIAKVLKAAIRARRDRDITRRLDELFSDPSVAKEQLRTTQALDGAGGDWSDEGW